MARPSDSVSPAGAIGSADPWIQPHRQRGEPVPPGVHRGDRTERHHGGERARQPVGRAEGAAAAHAVPGHVDPQRVHAVLPFDVVEHRRQGFGIAPDFTRGTERRHDDERKRLVVLQAPGQAERPQHVDVGAAQRAAMEIENQRKASCRARVPGRQIQQVPDAGLAAQPRLKPRSNLLRRPVQRLERGDNQPEREQLGHPLPRGGRRRPRAGCDRESGCGAVQGLPHGPGWAGGRTSSAATRSREHADPARPLWRPTWVSCRAHKSTLSHSRRTPARPRTRSSRTAPGAPPR